jgi:hypothetical protein
MRFNRVIKTNWRNITPTSENTGRTATDRRMGSGPEDRYKQNRILGQQVFRRLVDIPIEVDSVTVFRRSQDIPPHVEDIIGKMPTAVWLQSGIRNDAAAETLARPGSKSFRTAASWCIIATGKGDFS